MLEQKYYVAYEILRNIFHIEDPEQIAFFGIDEYDPEVRKLLPELIDCPSIDDLKSLIHKVFEQFFGSDIPNKHLDILAQRIWQEVLPTLHLPEYLPPPTYPNVRYRVGAYILRDLDYHYLACWAEALGQSPKALLNRLSDDISIEEGAITELVWDLDRLPIEHMDMRHLNIIALRLKGTAVSQESMPKLPLSLNVLSVRNLGLTELDLSGLPALTALDCAHNQLTELDLGLLPRLEMLDCSHNQLKKLDLKQSFNLLDLRCGSNQLTQLEFMSPKNLMILHCSNNQLTELNVSELYRLHSLYCWSNRLVQLKVSLIPPENRYDWNSDTEELTNTPVISYLRELDCSDNRLTQLDLSAMTHLQVLFCGSNQLTELDLRSVSHLELLDCSHNHISELDLSPVTALVELNCANNPFTALDSPSVAPLTRVVPDTYRSSDSTVMFMFGAEWRAHNQHQTDQRGHSGVKKRFFHIYPPPPYTPRGGYHVVRI